MFVPQYPKHYSSVLFRFKKSNIGVAMKKFYSWTLIIVIILCTFSCGLLIFTFDPNGKTKDDNASGDNIQIEQEIDWSNVTISCLGDSITYGQTIGKAYPSVLQDILGTKTCLNYGIGWSTCAVVNDCTCHSGVTNAHNAMCARYSQIAKSSDIIAVMCGVNDQGLAPLGNIEDTGSNTFYGSMNILCSGLKSKYSNSYIFFMTSFAYDNCNDLGAMGVVRKEYYHTAVKQVCEKYDIDVFDTFAKIDFSTTRDTTDNVHPNQNFVTNVWTPQIAQFIKDNYKK